MTGRVLVTGGAGFVGSQIARELIARGAQVTILDDLFTGLSVQLPDGADFVEGSVQDFDLVNRLVKNVDTVFHLATRNIVRSTIAPRQDMDVNIGGTLNVLMAARDHGIRRVVYTSSASVYGNARSYRESDPPSLLNPYAVSKLAAEHYSTMFGALYGTPVTILRYSNVYGPGRANPDCAGVIGKFFQACAAGTALRIHGDGVQTRDYTYIDDTVRATLDAAQSSDTIGQVLNVGTGVGTSVLRLANLVREVTHSPVGIEHVAKRDIDTVHRRVLDMHKLHSAIGWSPSVSLRNGLKATYEWFKEFQRG